MMRFRAVFVVAVGVLVLGLASVALGMREQARPLQPPDNSVGGMPMAMPFVIVSTGNTTWVQVHTNNTKCPGDPLLGHGGEATGGPVGSETWCYEPGIFPDSLCGSNPPWTTSCFKYVDIRSLPSQTGINYWHVDSYRTVAPPSGYTGTRSLWCGTSGFWPPGQTVTPVECGTWQNAPGYGKQWNCQIALHLPSTFNVAGGCTLYFDPRYDTECKYDYFYVDYWNGTTWNTLATFNATSNNPGSNCGAPSKPAPDYYGNVDANRLLNCNWQARTTAGIPAFKAVLTHAMLGTIVNAPYFRWRFTSDGGWDDMDGTGDSDGAAFVDNVWVYGDNPAGSGNASAYTQDFETSPIGQTFPQYWSLLNPAGVAQGWHLKHDPDAPYEGGDGDARTTCTLDSSWMFRARPEVGFPVGSKQRAGFFYSVKSPKVRINNTGAVVQYDQFMCAKDVTCDYTDSQVRFYDTVNATWCPWKNIDGYITYGGCFFWNFDRNEDVTKFYGGSNDSLQFRWDLLDTSSPGDLCFGKHGSTENVIDNVSIGFYNGNETMFVTRGIDILHDSFLPQVDQGYNSFFDAYDADSINWYKNSLHAIPRTTQLYIDVTDKDNVSSVQLKASINKGATWITKAMTFDIPQDPIHPLLGGKYYGDIKASDFSPGATSWTVGSEIWYYVLVTDGLSNLAYLPARANPAHADHNGTIDDQYHFVILPQFPVTYHGPKILLVDGHNRNLYDYNPCLTDLDNLYILEDMYENTLRDAGYCYDKWDISGAGTNAEIHPIWFNDYDAVVWFTGPYFSNYLFWKEAQVALRAYLADSGKVVLCGDRIAFDMAPTGLGGNGDDSLGGEFLGGILGTTYQKEMETAFNPGGLPFVYAKAAPTVSVFGTPVSVPLDTIVVYRECPYLKEMSYVQVNTSPPAGYTAQPLLHLTNPIGVTHADEAIYTEYQGAGQCVFVDFDLSAVINQKRTVCTGVTPAPAPDFNPGNYYGRVELMKAILFNLFGLTPNSGGGGTSDVPTGPKAVYRWALNQNSPNPLADGTKISYEVARTSNVSIKVFNAMGQLVKTLQDGRLEPNKYVAFWDGRNQTGERVSSGVYFCKMQTDEYTAVKKMAVVK
jgi:hypothetical protein